MEKVWTAIYMYRLIQGGSHIPHDKGLQSIREALDNGESPEIPTETIVDLAELVLRNNNFEGNENHYLQTLRTAIGMKMAPSYANCLWIDWREGCYPRRR